MPGRGGDCRIRVRVVSAEHDRVAFAEDSRMQNVVSLLPDRARPQRHLAVPRSGARILFFTGVRYCREDEPAAHSEPAPLHEQSSPLRLDATAH